MNDDDDEGRINFSVALSPRLQGHVTMSTLKTQLVSVQYLCGCVCFFAVAEDNVIPS